MTMSSHEQLRAAVEDAYRATEGITDPNLRAVALGRILDHLLAGREFESPRRPGGNPPPRGPKTRHAVTASRNGPREWVGSLVREGFFSNPRTLAEVTKAVRAQGHRVESKNVTDPLVRLVQSKVLRRENKSSSDSERGVWLYSNY